MRGRTIYMPLVRARWAKTDEWRPVKAVHVEGDVYRIVSENRRCEHWRFQERQAVVCEERELEGKRVLVAVRGAVLKLPRRPTWADAWRWLEGYDGAGTEIHVFDLPPDRLEHVLAVVAKLPDPYITTCCGWTLERECPFDADWAKRVLSCAPNERSAIFCCARNTSRHVEIYLWGCPPDMPFDVEIAFLNYLTFPNDLPDAERDRRLDRLVDLAEELRAGVPDALCMLASEGFDSRDDLGQEHVVVW